MGSIDGDTIIMIAEAAAPFAAVGVLAIAAQCERRRAKSFKIETQGDTSQTPIRDQRTKPKK